ncbi:protein misato homolog 1 isoform X1 [Falco peregrinus]|uniref:protein misato homolog 1 isoform X1 n=1 Tax=Falco peregrinus TaxID=8954 RepID=UPI002478E719|nr:protein misato homolog 1 isoform X1 [Falco peregrinus]
MPGEAVTLQLGQYAGCVGAHWWGLQAAALRSPADGAELRAAALLRAGGGREAATPRLVALELKGGVGALRPGGAGPEAPVAWAGPVAAYLDRASAGGSAPRDTGSHTARTKPLGPAPPRDPLPVTPQDAGASGRASAAAPGVALAPAPLVAPGEVSSGACVQLWSDYLNVHLHPRSLYVIRQYMHDGDCGCLEAFGQGESLLQDPGCLEELEDRLHFYVEECDYLQGFQVLCDLHNGFSGVGAKVTELLCDEYSGKGILTWGLTPVMSNMGDAQKNLYRLMNTALGIVRLSSHSSLFCPLSLSGSLGIKPQPPVAFPYINYNASLNYHSSAILAAALDTLTAPYRLHSSQGSMMHLADTLNFSGRKVVAAWASVPFPARCGYSLPDTLCAYQQDVPWKLLSSCREQKVSHCFAQSVVLRGICKESPTSSRPGELPPSPLHACGSTEQILQCYLHAAFPGAFSTAHVLEQPCHTLPPYPQFFSPLLTRQGFLLNKPPGYSSAAVESIPVLAALQSSPVLHTLLYSLYKDVRKLNMGRWASFFSAGVEPDDFQEALEELRTLSQCYETGVEADESEDEADSD